ncbi:protein LNK4 isoform X2 [Arachis duranensis]|uniref:Protein LNK4 isoform X2 n=1 Tax=Arachis duranensis TaxID=130453 RepID=A0A9C6TBK1_ARADU|nr:protein LNK4 isoform X2 [Arachis duranensis]
MDWYYGSDVNDFLVPKDQDLLDRHPSPGCWSNWGVNANEGFNLPKKFVVMDFMDESFDNQFRLESSIHDRFNESLNNQIELESSLQDKDGSSSSSVCGGLPEKSFQQTALSCDQPNHQLQDLPRFKQTDDIFLDYVPEDLPYVDNLEKSFNFSPENQCITPGQLQKHTAASNSDDLLDIKALPANVLDSYEQSSRDEVLNEQSSLEESILHDLEMVIGQFTEKTRICFRDALYRLARNNEHQHSVQDQEKDVDMKNVMLHMDQNQTVSLLDRLLSALFISIRRPNLHVSGKDSDGIGDELRRQGDCEPYVQQDRV